MKVSIFELRLTRFESGSAIPKGAPGIWERPTYQPPKDTPTRPGALDASRLPSRMSAGQATYPKGHA